MPLQCLVQLAKRSSHSLALDKVIGRNDHWTTINPRHIFRALLRECTYLPDSAARHYCRHHIIKRFRRHHPQPSRPAEATEPVDPTSSPKKLLKKARKALADLRQANDGHILKLRKVLLMTYGRHGKRRHELLAQITSDTMPCENAPSPLIHSTHIVEERTLLGKQLLAVASAQGLNTELASKIPEKNNWGRPLSPKRAQNIQKKWYADLLDQIMPPLPVQEWERLRDLCLGLIPWEGPVRRRKIATTTAHDCTGDQATANISALLGISVSQDSMQLFKLGQHKELATNPHKLTARFMRRLWTTIFLNCPKMYWNMERGKWTVRKMSLNMIRLKRFPPGASTGSDMFEGVDKNGKIVNRVIVKRLHTSTRIWG